MQDIPQGQGLAANCQNRVGYPADKDSAYKGNNVC